MIAARFCKHSRNITCVLHTHSSQEHLYFYRAPITSRDDIICIALAYRICRRSAWNQGKEAIHRKPK